jgi:hypothetical protein
MLEVAVQVERIDATRLSDKVNENAPSNYNLNVSLSERDRTSEGLVLTFQLELTMQPQIARIIVGGNASLKGTKDEVQSAITSSDESKPPTVLVTIYERIYGLIYLAAGSLRVPRPLPNLLKKAS